MFIELHNFNGRIDFNVDNIVALFEKDDGTHVCVTDEQCYIVKESINEIRAILDKAEHKIDTPEEEPCAVWEKAWYDVSLGRNVYHCSKCGHESYRKFDECPACKSKMKEEGE